MRPGPYISAGFYSRMFNLMSPEQENPAMEVKNNTKYMFDYNLLEFGMCIYNYNLDTLHDFS